MGIPKQVLDAEAEAEANLDADAGTAPAAQAQPKVEAPQVQAEAAGKAKDATPKEKLPTAEPQPFADSMLAKLSAESHKASSTLGRIDAIVSPLKEEKERLCQENERLRQENDGYNARLLALERQLAELKDAGAAKPSDAPQAREEGVSKEMIERLRKKLSFGDSLTDAEIANLVTAVDTCGEMKTGELIKRINALEASNRAERNRSFCNQVSRSFPGLTQMDANHDSRWVSFLRTKVSKFGDERFGDVVRRAIDACDFDSFAEAADAFAKSFNIQFSPSRHQPQYADVRPTQAGGAEAGGSGEEPERKPQYYRSEIETFRKNYLAKRSGLPQDVADAAIREIEDAEAEGRIVNDK